MTAASPWIRFVVAAFTENKGLKLLALVITLGLFVAVRAQEKVERWVDVEVEVIPPPPGAGLVITGRLLESVRVRVRGRRSLVNDIRQDAEKVVKVDLSTVRSPGSRTIFFEPEMFGFSGVEVVDVNPDAVSVRIEKLVTRTLPVRPKIVGRLQEGTRFVEPPTVTPPEVDATGPASVIRSITSLETREVGIDALPIGPYSEEVPLEPVEGLTFSRDRFVVRFEVGPVMEQRTFAGLLVQVVGAGDRSVEVAPTEVALSVSGPKLALDRLDPATLTPQVRIPEGSGPGTYRLPVEIAGLPEGIRVKTVRPEAVSVTVR